MTIKVPDRLDDFELAVRIVEGVLACGQDPHAELARIRALGDRDYYLALHAYQLAAMFARRQREETA